MGCTCRVMPLRIFVQGISQVHKFEATPFLRPRALPASTLPASSLAARQTRSFHMSRFLNQDAQTTTLQPPPDVAESSSTTQSATDTPPLSQDRQEAAQSTTDEPSAEVAEPHAASEPTEIDHLAQPIPNATRPKFKPRENNRFKDKERFSRDGKFKDKPWKSRSYNEDRGDTPWKARHNGPPRSRPFKEPKFSSEPVVGPAPGEAPENIPQWKTQKKALKEKFPEGWNPRKRLSPDALAGIRALNAQFPDVYTTSTLAKKFEVSPENIRRILKSKWQPNVDEEKNRQERWFKRGMQVWDRQAALGMKPPRKWRLEGITRDPSYHIQRQEAIKRGREREEQDDREIRANMRRGTKP